MANLEAPPSRYRIVERDRRLVVIDTQSGASVRQPRPAPASPPVRSPWQSGENSRNTDAVKPPPRSAPARPSVTIPAQISRDIASWQDSLINIGSIATESKRDGNGRPVLRTMKWFDDQAPRYFALERPATIKLGGGVAVVIALAVVGLMFAVFGDLFFALILIFVGARVLPIFIKPTLRSIIASATEVNQSDLR